MGEDPAPGATDAPIAAEPPLLRLLAVQDHDTAIDQLRHRLRTLPERAALTEREQALAGLEAGRAEIGARRHELGRTQQRFEDEIDSLGARIADTERSLYSGAVSAARELQALQESVAAAKRHQSDLEDQLLEVLEAIDPVDEEQRAAEAAAAEVEAEVARRRDAVAVAEGDVRQRLEQEAAARAAAAAGVPADLLATYERLRSSLGGVGAARLEGNRCLGCHLTLPATEVDAIRHLPLDAVVRHEECGRILVRTA